MIRNYLKVAFRNLWKNKSFSVINIGGLAIGMSVVILISLWIWDELSFDKYNSNYDRVAQVIQNVTHNGQTETWTPVPFPLGDELRLKHGNDFKYVVMASFPWEHVLKFGDKNFNKSGAYFEADAPYLLDLTMLKGNKTGLKDPSSIMISESLAKAYFGDADPLSKMMKLDNEFEVQVAGVYKDLPRNSSFADIGFMAPWDLLVKAWGLKGRENPWRSNSFVAYVMLGDQAELSKLSAKIRDVKLHKVRKDEQVHRPQLFLHPMKKWHLYSEFRNGVNTGGRIQYVWMFGIIGCFVLLLACINFMNLSTARSEKRARETGIRKAIGSLRTQLIFQFFSESMLVASLSFLLSLVVAHLLLPFFNTVAEKKMSMLWDEPVFWLLGIGFTFICGMIAGIYPALYLSSFRPVKVLKGTFRAGRFASIPRKALVVVQFVVSVALIIGTIIVFRQIQFAKNRSLGYNQGRLIMLPMQNREIHKHFDVVKNELKNAGIITEMAESNAPVTSVWSTNSGFEWKGKDPGLAVDFPNTGVSFDYGKTIGWELSAGRDFSRDFASDSNAFIINESAAKYMGLKKPVGEIIRWDGVPYTVIGVTRDILMESPFDPVRPSLFHLDMEGGNIVSARIPAGIGIQAAMEKIEPVFKKYNPEQPFDFMFADTEYAKKFGDEERIGKLAGFFSMLAILISCLGLFGITSFMAEQRVKEIGIRKVLGASVISVWKLLSKEFIILVLIALVIAAPLAYYFMYEWLQNYQYRTSMAWWMFASAGAGAIAIALITVSFQAIKAAVANPVKALRSE